MQDSVFDPSYGKKKKKDISLWPENHAPTVWKTVHMCGRQQEHTCDWERTPGGMCGDIFLTCYCHSN